MTLLFMLVMIILACCGLWRAALIMLGVTLVIDFIIAMIKVGARATLEDGVFALTLIAGPVKLRLLPKPEGKAKKPKKEKTKKERPSKGKTVEEPGTKQEEAKPKPKFKVTMELVTTALTAVGELLGRLRRKISIDRLTVHYTVASEDPASAAMTYGYASAAVSALMPVVENIFRVRERDVGVAVTFDEDGGDIFLDAQLTLAIWEIIYIALAVWPVVRTVIAQILNNRKVDKNGQSSDQ